MTNYQLNRRTVLKTAAYASLFGGGLTPVARNVQAQDVVTEKSTSFETESVGDTEPTDPWFLFGDGGTHEVSDTRASDGDQSVYTAFAPLGEPSAIAITLDVTSIDTIRSDVYIENANQFDGNIKVSKDSAGSPQDEEDNLSNFTPKQENTWHRNEETDISDLENEHTITFWVDGDNAAYWDNIRFISSATGTVIDDFESGELESAWYNAIDTSEFTRGDDFGRDAFTVQSDTAPEGDYAVRGDRTLQERGFSTISRDDFSPIDSDGSSISLYARVGPVINGFERANKIEFNEQTDDEGNDKRKVAILIDQKDRTDPPDDQARIGNQNTPNSNLSTPKLIEIQDINFSKNKVGAVRVAGEEVATDLNFLNDVSQITSVHLMQGHFEQPADIVVDTISFTKPESEPDTLLRGTVTDSAGQPLESIEVRANNQDTDNEISENTDPDGRFEIELEPNTEYRIFIFDEFGLEQLEFEEFLTLDGGETRELTIELVSAFQTFETQKLGSEEITGLAPRIDDLTTPLISEKDSVEAEIRAIESAVESGDISQDLADEALERMVLGEAIVNRTLEGLTDTAPLDLSEYEWSKDEILFSDTMPKFDLLFQTAKGIVIGLVEASFTLKKIAKDALGELGDQIVNRIFSVIGTYLRDLLSDYQRPLNTTDRALSIGEMLAEIDAAAADAVERLEEGPTFDNVRDVIKELAEPIAEQIANSLLAAAELLAIDDQLEHLNTTLGAASLKNTPEFSKDIVTVAKDTEQGLKDIEAFIDQAEEAMIPESDALEELIDLVGDLADAGLSDIPAILISIWDIVRDLVGVIDAGFNIGVGLTGTRQIYMTSEDVVTDITDTV